MNDDEASAFYDDPANLEPAGPPRRCKPRPLTHHVRVRFPESTVEQVRQLADADGVTVSGWIRHVVECSVRERGTAGTSTADTREVVRRLQSDVADPIAGPDRERPAPT